MTTVDDKLEILIDQVGRLSEGLTDIKLLVQQQAETPYFSFLANP